MRFYASAVTCVSTLLGVVWVGVCDGGDGGDGAGEVVAFSVATSC